MFLCKLTRLMIDSSLDMGYVKYLCFIVVIIVVVIDKRILGYGQLDMPNLPSVSFG